MVQDLHVKGAVQRTLAVPSPKAIRKDLDIELGTSPGGPLMGVMRRRLGERPVQTSIAAKIRAGRGSRWAEGRRGARPSVSQHDAYEPLHAEGPGSAVHHQRVGEPDAVRVKRHLE